MNVVNKLLVNGVYTEQIMLLNQCDNIVSVSDITVCRHNSWPDVHARKYSSNSCDLLKLLSYNTSDNIADILRKRKDSGMLPQLK